MDKWFHVAWHMKGHVRAPKRSLLLFQKKFKDLQGAKVEGIDVEIKVEVEVDKVEGKWRTKDCY
jgi:hypothetical protein